MSAAQGYPMKIGVSIYDWDELTCLPYDIVQLPVDIIKSDGMLVPFKNRGIEIHVRKVFANNCFEDAVKDENIDKVIIGIDNLAQLKENFQLCEKWEKENEVHSLPKEQEEV